MLLTIVLITVSAFVSLLAFAAFTLGARADEASDQLADKIAHGDCPHLPRGAGFDFHEQRGAM